jgi:hypothetical protein
MTSKFKHKYNTCFSAINNKLPRSIALFELGIRLHFIKSHSRFVCFRSVRISTVPAFGAIVEHISDDEVC